MNIDIESIGLLSLILQDSPKDRQFILCVLARSNSGPKRIIFNPNTDYPTFYGYSNGKIPNYLLDKGVRSNVPREGKAKRLISSHYLSHAETIINRAKNWDMHDKLMSVSKFITLDNKTDYKDAEVFLVFRDKASDYIKGYAASHEEEVSSFLGPEISGDVFKLLGYDPQGEKQKTNKTPNDQAVPTHKYFLTNSDLIESLQQQLSSFINLPEKGFFLGIADYVKFIDENSGFGEIISTIDYFRERDKIKLHELETKLFKDIRNKEKILMDRIKSKKVKSEIVTGRINEYEMVKDGRMQSSATKVEALYDGLCRIIMSLHENGYESIVPDLIELLPQSKSIADYKISDYYYPYKEELQEFRSKAQKTIWGAWNELVILYLVIHKYKERMAELVEKKDEIGQMDFHLLHKEIENVLGNAKDDPRRLLFIRDDYVTHINRVHSFVINKLKSEPNKNAEGTGEEADTLRGRYDLLLKEIRGKDSSFDLDGRYQKLLEENKSRVSNDEVNESDDITSAKNRPFCITEGKVGYLKFGKYGKKIKIGNIESRHFRLLQCLLEPLSVAKTVDAVFEAIRLPKDKNDSRLQDGYMAHKRKVELIEFAIKELQKGNKLTGKLIFEFDETKSKIWLKFIA